MLRFPDARGQVCFVLKNTYFSAEVLHAYDASSQKLRQLFHIILNNFTSWKLSLPQMFLF